MDAAIEAAAKHLAAAGLSRGDRVALLGTPRPEYLLLWFAASRIGAVYVGLNPRYTSRELSAVLEQVRPRFVFTLRSFEGTDLTALLAATRAPAPVIAFTEFDELVRVLEALPAPAPAPDDGRAPGLEQCAAIVFTSGSTGRPKAAMLTHEGLLLAAAVQHDRLGPPSRPRLLNNLPINHVGCLMNLTLGAFAGAGSVVFMERFDAARTLELIVEERVTTWLQVPAMYHACVNDPRFDPAALRGVHVICIGGGAASASTIARLRSIGARLVVEYGQTETASSAAYSDDGADDTVLAGCIGRFEPRFDFRIARDDGTPCPPGEVGEIQARGPLLFAGYFGDPEATRAAFTADGWLHTGDLAMQRPDGNVVLSGRLREMIKTGGYNVYPREIETILESHPAVDQAVVVGLPDDRYGEAVHAVVRLRCDVSSADLLALCRAQLANFKVPKRFGVIDGFPLLPNGKIDRIRTRALADDLRALS
jgi:acyl-CoA synthetase (AMP-forming)/AMP-acid ligase II